MSPDTLTLPAIIGAAVCVGVAIASARLTWRQRAGLIAGAATLLGGALTLLRGERRDAPEPPPPPPPTPPPEGDGADVGALPPVRVEPTPNFVDEALDAAHASDAPDPDDRTDAERIERSDAALDALEQLFEDDEDG